MQLTKQIKLNTNIYYIIVDVEYRKYNNIPLLCLKNFDDDYWDGGDCSLLIEELEKKYIEYENAYDKHIWLMNDVLYIYEHIPFISGVKTIYLSKDNIPYAEDYISKQDIDNYIKDFNIKLNINNNFKLYNSQTWNI